MGETGNRRLQSPLVQAGIPLRAKENRPLTVVNAVDAPVMMGECKLTSEPIRQEAPVAITVPIG